MENKDLYAALGVTRDASEDEIRRAYRKLARKHHPDVNPGNDAAEERFKEISEAHDILSDAGKRKLYDEFGMAGMQAGFDAEQARAASRAQSFTAGGGRHQQGFGGYESFDDLFGDIFRDRAAQGRGKAPQQAGRDFESEIEIGLLDAVRGLSTEISLDRESECSDCGGHGVDLAAGSPCGDCGGSGRVHFADGPVNFLRQCPSCGGHGRVGARPCASCGGRGRTSKRERLAVKIPPGVEDGSRVRVAGKGGGGAGGGAAGDLYLLVKIRPHPAIERKGNDLYVDLPVTVSEAIAGAAIEVPTPDGSKVRVRIPPRTQSGVRLRIGGHGVPALKGGGRGDLYLRVEVRIPEGGGDSVAEAAAAMDGGYGNDVRGELRFE